MKRAKRSGSRGASYVGVLVAAGIVVTLGVGAVQLIGSAASEKGDKQSSCMQSFSCADGASPGGAGQPFAGLPGTGGGGNGGGNGTPTGAGAPPGGGNPAPAAAVVAPPRTGFWANVGGFFSDVARGAVLGDYAEGSSVGQTIGQIGIGLVPIAGQAADIRDISSAIGDVWNGRPGGWINLAASTVGIVPLVGDAGKTLIRGGRALSEGAQAVTREGTQAIARNADEVGPAVRALSEADEAAALLAAAARRSRQAVEEVTAAGGVRLSEQVANATREQLERALRDPDYARQLGGGVDPRTVQRDAAIRLSREDLPNLQPGQIMTREQLQQQATRLGHEVTNLPNGYRVDQRSPREIAAAGGFTPNPNKNAMTLWEHTARGSEGGSNLVSFSTIPGNPATVTDRTGFFTGRPYLQQSEAEILRLSEARDIAHIRPVRQVMYEYNVRNVDSVTLRGAAYADEAEALATNVPTGQIAQYREIIVMQRPYLDPVSGHVMWHPREAVFGPWRPFP